MPADSGKDQSIAIDQRQTVFDEIEKLITIENPQERAEAEKSFVEKRLRELGKKAVKKNLSVFSPPEKNFIHPDSAVITNVMFSSSFRINDDQIYLQLLEAIEEFRKNPNWAVKSLRETLPYAILRAVGQYFGNYCGYDDSETKRRTFYLDNTTLESGPISLVGFKNKGFTACSEKAAVTHNLLTFLGYNDLLVFSGETELVPGQSEVHTYNVLTTENGHFIFEITNPVFLYDREGNIINFLPAVYRISQEQFEELMSGGKVEVEHKDLVKTGEEIKLKEITKRIYAGPSHP